MFSKPFQWLTALPLLLVTGALAVIALGALAGAQSPDARWRERLFDYFQRRNRMLLKSCLLHFLLLCLIFQI